MSVRMSTRVWDSVDTITDRTDLVLMLAIADQADDNGRCFPGIRRLCQMTRSSRSTILRKIEQFQARGWLIVTREPGRSNIYTLVPPTDPTGGVSPDDTRGVSPDDTRSTVTPVSPDDTGGVSPDDTGGVSPDDTRPITYPLTTRDERAGRATNGSAEAAQKTKTRTGAKRKTSLPTDWAPSPAHHELAAEFDLTAADVALQAEQFLDYHRSKGTVAADWDAGFRTWIRNTRRYGGAQGAPRTSHRQPADDRPQVFTRNAGYDRVIRQAHEAHQPLPTARIQAYLAARTDACMTFTAKHWRDREQLLVEAAEVLPFGAEEAAS